MVDSQILKSKLHIFLNFEFFLLSQISICLVQLIYLVYIKHTVSFLSVSLHSLLLLVSFLVQTSSTKYHLYHLYHCLKYHCEDIGQVVSLLWKGEAETKISKSDNLRYNVSLAQTFTPACPAAPVALGGITKRSSQLVHKKSLLNLHPPSSPTQSMETLSFPFFYPNTTVVFS